MDILRPQPVSKGPRHICAELQLPAGAVDFMTDIIIHPEACLHIAAGAHVHFAPGTGLAVMGSLKIKGTDADKVTFSGKNWRGLSILGPRVKGIELEYVHVSGAIGGAWSGEFDGDGAPVFAAPGPDNKIRGGGCLIAATGPEPVLMSNIEFQENSASHRGGALAALNATVQLTHCTFTGNLSRDGGALYLNRAGVEIDTCTFTNNGSEQMNGAGGAIAAKETIGRLTTCSFSGNHQGSGGAVALEESPLTIHECSFEENVAQEHGGALILQGKTLPQVIMCTFSENQTTLDGGAIFVHSQGNRALAIGECTFEGNLAGQFGGALASGTDTPLEIAQCVFVGNKGTEDSPGIVGGALHCSAGSRISIIGSRFNGNSAQEGGAIAYDTRGNPEGEPFINLALKETTFAENRAVQSGGAIAVSPHGTLDVGEKCRFSANEAGIGGGAIHVAPGGKIQLIGTGFDSNVANIGGAIAWHGTRGRLDSCIFGKNEAREFGGAIACIGAIYLNSCKFIQNTAQSMGGALWCAEANSMIGACTFTANTAGGSAGGGAIRCEAEEGPYQDRNQFTKNLPNDVAYLKETYPATTRKSGKQGANCWIVTAYYGDPRDPHVCAIRALREEWLADPWMRPGIAWLNDLYLRAGETPPGRWWMAHLHHGRRSPARRLTQLICTGLYALARRRPARD